MADSRTQDHTEVEWQFEAPDVLAAARWLQAAVVPGYTVTAGAIKELRDTYFDTASWAVNRGGFTCRVREKKDGAEVTLKSMAEAVGGIRSRREMNEAIPPDLSAVPARAPGGCGQALRLLAGRQPLRPLFTLDQVRRVFYLDDPAGRIAELAADQTTVPLPGGGATVLGRVEVEVEPGALDRARRFVDLLAAANRLTPAATSKFGAGLAAAGLDPQAGLALGPTAVSAEMTTAEVGFAILRKHFGVMLANEPGTRLGEDIEFLHDMRVATRRLRAALSAFRPHLSPRMQAFRLELGRVAAALGEVRDLDVQLERTEEWKAALPARAAALQPVEDLLQARRETARKRMLVALNSRWYELLEARFTAVLRRGAPRTAVAGHEPILATAPALLERRFDRVWKDGRKITPASLPVRYHLLRIDAKKLRYALEFVGPVYGRPAIDLSVRVTALQDLLGLHQDAEVAIETLDGIAAASGRRLPPETLVAIGAVAERYRTQAAQLRAGFPAVFGPLAGKEWQELRKAMAKGMRRS